jgi:hypothetical protein
LPYDKLPDTNDPWLLFLTSFLSKKVRDNKNIAYKENKNENEKKKYKFSLKTHHNSQNFPSLIIFLFYKN